MFLLDTNVLVALAWPAHSAHASAQRWFAKFANAGWATCAITQCGFVRILSNPVFSPHAVRPDQALSLLATNLKHTAHSFWADNIELPAAIQLIQARLTGHQQITDAYLLGLAVQHKGKLATFDRGVLEWAENAATHVELIR